ncbi:hypothetical protein O3G_MSEX012179 [Manduca sexta]|uniref:Multidrug resistance-associated protein lethal(2)03659 n=1 Tax=Manduca sexta TaxID=7130 RepID=A0A921ZMI2_MANSE|nr:hypothetical protein O3G_MSEX012179 [Manduca sexta]
MFWGGLKREMEENDLYEPLAEHSSGPLGDKFARLWEEEVARAGSKRKPSLLRVILRAYAARCMLYGFVLLVMECGIRIAQPLFLGKLVEYYSVGNHMESSEAYLYAGAVVLCSALNVFVVHPYMMAILHMGMKFRVACCSLIYRKSLRLSKTALGETTVGQVVNLLSNDVNRFDVAIIFLHYLWIGPLATVIITYFIHEIKQIRATSYIRGVLTSFIMFTTRICLFCSILAYVLVNNVITAKQVFVVTSFYNILRQTMTVFFPQGIAQVAEATISIKRLQSFMLYEDTSKPVPGLAEIQTSTQPKEETKESLLSKDEPEIQKDDSKLHVVLPEYKDEAKGNASRKDPYDSMMTLFANLACWCGEPGAARVERGGRGGRGEGEEEQRELAARVEQDARGVRLKHATAKWVAAHPENTLTDLSLTIKPGKLIAVIGPVGAGKSSLLHVLLRELPLLSGSVHVGGTVSYASQEPWLFAGSVRQNILFGQAMDRPRYNAVVRRCALDRDFSLFPHGDKTIVGERGVSLSGGQRARISLARAVYKRADIYLLDDPLSAVDAHVGRHLFESCVVGYLRNTTRILVTHQLQFLRDVDQIIILKNGAIAAAGNFDTLSASGLDFATLLARDEEEEKEEKAPPDTPVSNDTDELVLQGSFRKRQMSIHSVSSVDNLTATAPPEGPRSEAELRSAGAVSGRVYGAYLRASGHPLLVALMLFVATLAQLLGSASDWWTGFWVNLEEAHPIEVTRTLDEGNVTGPFAFANNVTSELIDNASFDNVGITRYDCIYIYSGMVIALVVISLLRSFMFFSMAMRASTRLHNNMFASITRAPMRFFHVNPSGRILNRFSKDMGAVDEVLPSALLDVLQIGLSLIGIVVVVAVVNYWLLVPTVAIGAVFYGLRIFYLSSSRSIKRLEGVSELSITPHRHHVVLPLHLLLLFYLF